MKLYLTGLLFLVFFSINLRGQNCASATNLRSIASAHDFISVNWDGSIGFTQVRYATHVNNLATASLDSVIVKPFIISGLNASTTYYIQFRDSCVQTGVVSFSDTLIATTTCLPIVAPFSENFNSGSWNYWNGNSRMGTIDNCWRRDTIIDYGGIFWKAIYGNPSGKSGPAHDHTSGSTKFAYIDRGGGSTILNDTTFLESPPIDLSNLINPQISFWYHKYGGAIGDLLVAISKDDGLNFTHVTRIHGMTHDSADALWTEKIIDLSQYVGDTIRVRFLGTQLHSTDNVSMAIDDFEVSEAPPCPKAQDIRLISTGAYQVTLDWLSATANSWQLSYGPIGFSPANGTIVTATTNPYTLKNLSPNNTYQVYIRENCPGFNSSWWGPFTVSTYCAPLNAPFTEDFDGSNFTSPNIPGCWKFDVNKAFLWRSYTTVNTSGTGPAADHTTGTGNFIGTFDDIGFAGGDNSFRSYLTVPPINLGALNKPGLSFWYYMYGKDIDSLEVFVENGLIKQRVKVIRGQQHSGKNDQWKEAWVNLHNFQNDTLSVIFVAHKGEVGTNHCTVALDDISVFELPSCPKPQELQFISSTSDKVGLSWLTGGAGNWQIQYGPQGFTLGQGMWKDSDTKPVIVSGLSAGSSYEFYVRDSCGIGNVSAWVGPIAASTACGEIAAPYFENFDSSNFSANNYGGLGVFDSCWGRDLGSTLYWTPLTTSVQSRYSTGAAHDYTSRKGTYIGTTHKYAALSVDQADLITPSFDLNAVSAPQLRFYSHMYGDGIRGLQVDVWNGAFWQTEYLLQGEQQIDKVDNWSENLVDLSHYAGDTIRIRFRALSNYFGSDIGVALDDFELRETPTCPRPDELYSDSSSTHAVRLNWNTAGASEWQIGYRVSGHTSPLKIVNANSKPFTVSNLQAGRMFEFYVRDSCGLGDVSFWSDSAYAETLCDTILAPYYENFDGLSWKSGVGQHNQNDKLDKCWSRGTDPNLVFMVRGDDSPSPFSGPVQDVSGTGNYLYTHGFGWSTGDVKVFTPYISIPAILVNPTLKFAYHMFDQFGTQIQGLEVWVEHPGGKSLLTSINGSTQSSSAAPWLYKNVDLSPYQGQVIRLEFRGAISRHDGRIAIDEIEVDGVYMPCGITKAAYTDTTMFLEAQFNSGSTQTGDSLFWDFGDGTTSHQANPVHVFPSAGTYSVKLKAFNDCGYGDSLVKNLLICDTIIAQATHTMSGFTGHFSGDSSRSASSYWWDFGNGVTAKGVKVSHTYNGGGNYVVTLVVKNNCGDSDTAEISLQGVAIDEYDHLPTLSIYPNPSEGYLSLSWDSEFFQVDKVELINSSGAILEKWDVFDRGGGRFDLNVQSLSKGLYWIKVFGSDTFVLRKIILR